MRDHQKAPCHVEDQDSPEPERLTTPQEEAGLALSEMENPPQAEGPREPDADEPAGERKGEPNSESGGG